jgi:hypothetical protein
MMTKKHLMLILSFLLVAVGYVVQNKPLEPNSQVEGLATETTTSAVSTGQCKLNGFLPDKTCNPGVTDPNVTQENIYSTICKKGYTQTVRPDVDYTNKLKIEGIQAYGYADTKLSDYEEDHIIPLEVGGSPSDPKNLFPEPIEQAKLKDLVENYLNAEVCDGKLDLKIAQNEVAKDWYNVYLQIK